MNQPSLTKDQNISTLAAGAGVSVIGRVLGGGINLVSQVVFARVLGAELFGLFSIGWTILRLLQLLSPLGVDKATIKFGSPFYNSNNQALHEVLKDTALFTIVTGSLSGLALFLLSPWLSIHVFQKPALIPVLQFFAAVLPIATISRVASISTRVSRKIHYSVISEEFVQPLITLACFIGVWIFGGKLLGAVFSTIVGFSFSFFVALFFINKVFPDLIKSKKPVTSNKTDNYSRRELIRFSIATFLAGTFLILSNRIDRLIVGSMLPANEVGIYQAVSQLCTFVPLILAGFGSIITPMIATLYYQNREKELQEIYIVSTKWGLYLTSPFILAIAFIPDTTLGILFGDEYRAGSSVLSIMLIGQFVAMATGSVSPLMIMTGHQRFWLVISSTTFVINVLLTWILIKVMGLKGAAIANCVSISLLYISGLIYIKMFIGIFPFDTRYWKGITAITATFLGLYGLLHFKFSSDFIKIVSTTLASVLTFYACLILIGMDDEDKNIFGNIKNKIKFLINKNSRGV